VFARTFDFQDQPHFPLVIARLDRATQYSRDGCD
jgi:hypothetical protein